MKTFTAAERLIVAADFHPRIPSAGRDVISQLYDLSWKLDKTAVYLKVNSALRSEGYRLIRFIRLQGLKVFADLKLLDIEATLAIDGELLFEEQPEIVTVAASSSKRAMAALREKLPNTELLGVTVPSDVITYDCESTYGCSIPGAIFRLARQASEAGLDGLIAAAAHAKELKAYFPSLTINSPGIRLEGVTVTGDDQNPEYVMTPRQAIQAGADRIICGRPITRSADPYGVTMQVIAEIASAL